MGTAFLPHTVSCVVFFGFGVPLVGALGVSRHLRTGSSPERRDQARLLITVLTGVLATATVLALVTVVMALLGQPGLTLDDPTARHDGGGGAPTALLFWFARLSAAALALAVLAAYRPWVRSAADRLHRALTTVVVVVAVGGAVALVLAVAARRPGRLGGRARSSARWSTSRCRRGPTGSSNACCTAAARPRTASCSRSPSSPAPPRRAPSSTACPRRSAGTSARGPSS